MDEPTASLSDQEVEQPLPRDPRAEGAGRRDHLHLAPARGAARRSPTASRPCATARCVGTRPMAEVDRAELIRLMVGRELSAVFPKTTVPIGDVVLEVRGLGCRASGVRDVDLERPRRRDPRPGRAGRRGPDRAGAGPLRPDPRRRRRDPARGQAGHDRLARRRPSTLGIAYVPEDRRRHGVILEMSVATNTTLATLRAISSARPARLRPRARARRRLRRSGSGSRRRSHRRPGGQPLGRQPAEGRAGPLAGGRARGPDPRRADAGGRRRGQGRDPPPHGRARRRGAWRS